MDEIFVILTHAASFFFTSLLAILVTDCLLGNVDTMITGFTVTDKFTWIKKVPIDLALDLLTDNAIIYVLIAWVVILGIAKAQKLEKHGFKITPYSLTYKNTQVQSVLSKMLTRTKRGIRVFADVSVVAGFLMMGFAFWFC